MAQSADQLYRTDYTYRKFYRYEAPWTTYAMSWIVRPDQPFRLAVGSFVEEHGNKVQVVSLANDGTNAQGDFVCSYTMGHTYPVTKVMSIPDPQGIHPDLLATSGDYLWVWRLAPSDMPSSGNRASSSIHSTAGRGIAFPGCGRGANVLAAAAVGLEPQLECVLNHNINKPYCLPLTSFDWNDTDTHIMVTSCSDHSCTVWSLETHQVLGRVWNQRQQQTARENQEVYDVAFGGSRDLFASVGANAILRIFDIRNLHKSSVVYQQPENLPLLRLAWNKQDPNYIATLTLESTRVTVLDVRKPGTALLCLNEHKASVNGVTWSPDIPGHLCTAADDYQALIWNIHQEISTATNPILSFSVSSEINNAKWSTIKHEWIAICYKNFLEILRI